MARRAEIVALHEEERHALLERLGVAGDYESGALVCCVCEHPLRERGIGAVRMVDGRVLMSCGHLDCMEEFGG